MNWNERLEKWLNSMETTAGKINDFGAAEVPQYLQELIHWEIVNGCVAGCVFLLASLCCILVAYLIYRFFVKDGQEIVFSFVFLFLSIPLLAFSCSSFKDALKAYTAPRVVLVEKVAGLIKQSKT